MSRAFVLLLACILSFYVSFQNRKLPEGFVYVKDLIPDIVLEIRYAGSNNFMGRPIKGYKESKAILTRPAAEALKKAQADLQNNGYCLKIFDAYRPQKAVNNFIEWARDPEDTLMKIPFYPEVEKQHLFNLGYISTRSGHSRGSTVDLTLLDANTEKEVDMGSSYDYFGDISHHNAPGITLEQKQNRELLKKTMAKFGFFAYPMEWWHYSYKPEAFPQTYFDFDVE